MTWARAGVIAAAGLGLTAGLLTLTWRAPAVDGGGTPAAEAPGLLDPQKGRWGGHSVDAATGFTLSARVTPVVGRDDLFEMRIRVHAPEGFLADGTPVVFHLHPSFTPPVVRTELRKGEAELIRRGWSAFTVGAVVEPRNAAPVQLELDLAELSDAPRRFRER